VFVVIVAHFLLRGAGGPHIWIVFLHILAFAMALGTFVYSFLNFPYNDCRNTSGGKGCQIDKAAVPLDGVLMYAILHLKLTL
jgi:hypothetical protein